MPAPTRLGRYEVKSLLGQGGMGAVYQARDPVLDRIVALKTISPLLLAGGALRDEYLERFQREARAAGRLSHPHIVSVFDLGYDEASATPFIVMEYVAGASLETVLAENPALPLGQALEIVEQVASGLEEAHRNGIVHRDIKPANIFLDNRGRVKVGDFGVARLEGSELTHSGVGLGTPGYSAPEVVRGGTADARSDVFALGVLAYRVLTGRRPFGGATRETAAIEILEREPVAPSSVRPEVPDHVSAAVMRALAKAPEARTASAAAFARELRAAVPGAATGSASRPPAPEGPPGTTVSLPPSADPPAAAGGRPDRRLVLAALLIGAMALGIGAFLALRSPRSTGVPGRVAAPPKAEPAAARQPSGPRRLPPSPVAGDAAEEAAKAVLREAGKRAEEWTREQLDKADGKPAEEEKSRGKPRGTKKKKDRD